MIEDRKKVSKRGAKEIIGALLNLPYVCKALNRVLAADLNDGMQIEDWA